MNPVYNQLPVNSNETHTQFNRQLSGKWLKAAVVGSIWAAFEIIVGSFLHNLRIPFAGMFLAAASVFLLVAFMQLWREKGIIIRAGIICALMKSISPSAIILGPMLGIFMEAVIIESVVWLAGRHVVGYILAGALAVVWTLMQKILNLVILYGFDLINIAEDFYRYLAKQIPFIGTHTTLIVVLIFGAYALFGGLSAFFGYRTGSNFNNLPPSNPTLPKPGKQQENPFFGIDPSHPYSFLNLALVLVAIVLNLYLINSRLYLFAAFSGFLFMFFCAFRYKRALRHLRKPLIWVQFFVVILVTSFFWDYLSTGNHFSTEGLRVGLEMNFRALVIIFGFSAISVELRNPLIKLLLFRNGFSQLYIALNLAFSALPGILEQLPRPKNIIRQRIGLMRHLLAQADRLLTQFQSTGSPLIFIITGDVHEGKTTYVEKLISIFRSQQYKVAGFLAIGSFQNDKRHDYKLLNLSTNEVLEFAKSQEQPGWIKFRRFWFNPAAIKSGNDILQEAQGIDDAIVVVDEVGPMEVQGDGWHNSLMQLTLVKNRVQLWVVRRQLATTICERYALDPAFIIDIARISEEEAIQIIIKKAAEQSAI